MLDGRVSLLSLLSLIGERYYRVSLCYPVLSYYRVSLCYPVLSLCYRSAIWRADVPNRRAYLDYLDTNRSV